MKRFKATLTFVQHSRAEVVIRARTREEAWQKAELLEAADIEEINPIHGELHVESVDPD